MIGDLTGRQVHRCGRRDDRLTAFGASIHSLPRRATLLITGYSGGPAMFKSQVRMGRIIDRRHRVAPADRREHNVSQSPVPIPDR